MAPKKRNSKLAKPSDTKPKSSRVIMAPNLNPSPTVAKPFTGSNFEDFSNVLMTQIINAVFLAYSNEEEREAQQQACFGALAGIGPKDETEGMLAAQMLSTHNAAMECFRRAMLKEQSLESRQMNLNYANKLSRTYALHMEALDKHRGKGQQKVTVEHVHVHQGGQAIVGTVQTGGSAANSEEQPHAKSVAHEPEQEMRSAFETNREAVPERCDEER